MLLHTAAKVTQGELSYLVVNGVLGLLACGIAAFREYHN
jgi:hypothetical protein